MGDNFHLNFTRLNIYTSKPLSWEKYECKFKFKEKEEFGNIKIFLKQ